MNITFPKRHVFEAHRDSFETRGGKTIFVSADGAVYEQTDRGQKTICGGQDAIRYLHTQIAKSPERDRVLQRMQAYLRVSPVKLEMAQKYRVRP